MRPGDVFVLNAPYNGGTHLPDVTVIAPVFLDCRERRARRPWPREPEFFVASRGHHADIGGITPGSMPPDSTHVDEEGVLLDNVQLVAEGRFLEAEMRAILASGRYPSRNVDQNLADLRAQVAACAKGAHELAKMVAHFGLPVVRAYMQHVQDNAEESVRRVLDVAEGRSLRVRDGQRRQDRRDDHRSTRRRGARRVDFTGTSAQQPTNFNAPSAVCKAAVLYVFRTLVDDEIPMNAGCLKPLDIVIPEGSMLAPRYPAAVVAGNVETSQAITDALYGALGVLAASQGTMNNFTFGNATYQYYETISGGSGAGPGFRRRERGADAHDEFAAHRSRGARVALPGAPRVVRDPPRQRRRGPASRRRRRRAARPLPRADDGGHARQPSPHRAVRRRRRPAGRGRDATGSSGRPIRTASARGIRRDVRGRDAGRRRFRRRDAGRRRIRAAGVSADDGEPGARAPGMHRRQYNRPISEETAMASVYDFTVKDIRGKEVKLDRYKGKVLLIVNTASECGFTPQYKGLEALYEKLHDKGLEVLGFPCNQFGAQEPGSEKEIASFCEVNYGVTFPLFAKVDVNGDSAAPLYRVSQEGEAGAARLRGDQVELHQVPGRPRRATSSSAMRRTTSREAIAGRHREAAVKSALAMQRVAAHRWPRSLLVGVACVAPPALAQPDPNKVLRVAFPVGGDRLRSAGGRRPLLEQRQSRDLRPAVPVRLSRAAVQARARTPPSALPEISPDGKTWTIRIKPGIYFTDDPAFKGKKRELTAADYVYAWKRMLDPKMRSQLAADRRRPIRRHGRVVAKAKETGKFDYDAPMEGLQAIDRYTLQFKLNFAVVRAAVEPHDGRRRPAVAREVIEAYGDARAGRWRIRSAPDRTGSRTGGAARRSCSRRTRTSATSRYPESSDPADERVVREVQGQEAAADRPHRDQHHRGRRIRACSRSSRASSTTSTCRPISSPNVLDPGNKLKPRFAKAGHHARARHPAGDHLHVLQHGGSGRRRLHAREDRAAPRDRHGLQRRRGNPRDAPGAGGCRRRSRAAGRVRPRPQVRRTREVRPRGGEGAARQVRLRRPRQGRLARPAGRQAAGARRSRPRRRRSSASTTSCGSGA